MLFRWGPNHAGDPIVTRYVGISLVLIDRVIDWTQIWVGKTWYAV